MNKIKKYISIHQDDDKKEIYNFLITKYDKNIVDKAYKDILNIDTSKFSTIYTDITITDDELKFSLINKYKSCVFTSKNYILCDVFTFANKNEKATINNSILVSVDIKQLLENYLISIDENTKIVLSKKIMIDTSYQDYYRYNNIKLDLDKNIIDFFKNHYIKFQEINIEENKNNKISKKIKYAKERIEILQKIKNILEIDKYNLFYTWDIQNDENKKKQIMELKDDIFKYFYSKDRSVFIKNRKISKPELSLVKIVLSEMDINVLHTRKTIKRNDKSIKSGCYLFSLS